MSIHGWLALAIAVFGTALLAVVLMALAFHSSRNGYDARIEDVETVYDQIRRRPAPRR